MPAIEVNLLTRTFDGLTAVQNLTFMVQESEIFGFLGPNGAGKTTTIRMLTGQLRPSGGDARVMGCDIVADRMQLMPRIGVVFEHQNLYMRLSAVDNLTFTAKLYGVRKDRVAQVLHQVGLEGRASEKIANYSNGMKQRLMIARAVLHEPAVLFLDEPTKGLDPGVAREIRLLIHKLAQNGMTIFLSTHYMEEADRMCDRVGIIDRGRLVCLDSPQNLKSRSGLENPTLENVFLQKTGRELY
ncbi:MAG: ABC transporter ATP-binding protein [Anaerolineales bacterium]|jgi:ABC-2 type transport system ATP-binding protein